MSSRKCLKCDKEFESGGIGNRICNKCHRVNDVPSEQSGVDVARRVKAALKKKNLAGVKWRGRGDLYRGKS